MQGSRQAFYRGDVWNALTKRISATLRRDPDLLRLEAEAEEQVAALELGSEKVKETLDQLIASHHDKGWRSIPGAGTSGNQSGTDLGFGTIKKDGVVTLLPPKKGQAADYPVLQSDPASSNVRLRPNIAREVQITSRPAEHWQALSELSVDPDTEYPELLVETQRLSDAAKLTLLFREPDVANYDQYPVRASLRITARFNGLKEPRQLVLQVLPKPEEPAPEPLLVEVPTKLKVSTRQPVRVCQGEGDTHVRLRWDGKDRLLTGRQPAWRLTASIIGRSEPAPEFNFSQPSSGRFSLLISPRPEWRTGDKLQFEVIAYGPGGRALNARFVAEVLDPPEAATELQQPRLVNGAFPSGASRRPPYDLLYITQKNYAPRIRRKSHETVKTHGVRDPFEQCGRVGAAVRQQDCGCEVRGGSIGSGGACDRHPLHLERPVRRTTPPDWPYMTHLGRHRRVWAVEISTPPFAPARRHGRSRPEADIPGVAEIKTSGTRAEPAFELVPKDTPTCPRPIAGKPGRNFAASFAPTD